MNLYKEDVGYRPLLDGMPFDCLSEVEEIMLEKPFSELEIQSMINDMIMDKAPKLDGFSIGFFQRCWDIIRNDLMTFLGMNSSTRN